jgi:hypothetical protein
MGIVLRMPSVTLTVDGVHGNALIVYTNPNVFPSDGRQEIVPAYSGHGGIDQDGEEVIGVSRVGLGRDWEF